MRDFDANTVRPIGNRVLIEEDPKPTRSEGGAIILPDTVRDAKFCTPATVLQVGPGRVLKNGEILKIDLKPGDRVVLAKAHGSVIHGERIRIVDYDVIDGLYEQDAAE